MIRGFTCLMLVTAVCGVLLAILGSGTLFLALGMLLLMIGSGGVTAAWMGHASEDAHVPATARPWPTRPDKQRTPAA